MRLYLLGGGSVRVGFENRRGAHANLRTSTASTERATGREADASPRQPRRAPSHPTISITRRPACRLLAELRQGSETEPVSLERTRCTVSTRGRIRERVGESHARHSDGGV